MINEQERDRLTGEIAKIWPRVESGEATLEEVRRTALSVFDRLGSVGALDAWEKHHFITFFPVDRLLRRTQKKTHAHNRNP